MKVLSNSGPGWGEDNMIITHIYGTITSFQGVLSILSHPTHLILIAIEDKRTIMFPFYR